MYKFRVSFRATSSYYKIRFDVTAKTANELLESSTALHNASLKSQKDDRRYSLSILKFFIRDVAKSLIGHILDKNV